jgi:hypothetical protein
MKLTNEKIALAFGWRKVKPTQFHINGWTSPEKKYFNFIPDFLGSVDATIQELERMGIMWQLQSQTKGAMASIEYLSPHTFEDTAAKALATAAYNYLRKRK